MDDVLLSVSDFVAIVNQTLDYAYPSVSVVGEVAEYRVSQGKWVSFKLKDGGAVVNCFAGIYQLRTPLEDGMKVVVVAQPKLNPKGYFNLNVRSVRPVGEGSIKKGFELLKAKLEAEGLFSPERKRTLPRVPQYVGLITSTESAAYADFTRIINERWGGLRVDVAHTQVQGEPAADQIIRAVHYFNQLPEPPEVIVIIRGGGSAEDLMTFNDEPLARAIAASRVPTLVGVGHEIDHSLADMVADVRAATPTHAAETLVPDRREIIRSVRQQVVSAGNLLTQSVDQYQRRLKEQLQVAVVKIDDHTDKARRQLVSWRELLAELNPQTVLARGYAILRDTPVVGASLTLETSQHIIETEVQHVSQK